jgi:hypothetical protein
VFVTAYDEFALDAFDRAAVDYLVKPVTDERLARTMERLRKAFQDAAPMPELAQLLRQLTRGQPRAEGGGLLRWVRASRGNTTSHVPIQDVMYFHSDDKYVVVHTRDGEHLIRTPLAELAEGLDPDVFWQVHRSTIVNMECVAGRAATSGRLFVRMRDSDTELPVSRAYAPLQADVAPALKPGSVAIHELLDLARFPVAAPARQPHPDQPAVDRQRQPPSERGAQRPRPARGLVVRPRRRAEVVEAEPQPAIDQHIDQQVDIPAAQRAPCGGRANRPRRCRRREGRAGAWIPDA